MNKYEYLAQLRSALFSVSQEEREAAMSYYEEFFNDAGEENEQSVIASLGSPQDLAQSIINENSKNEEQTTSSDNSGFDSGGFIPPPTPTQQSSGWTGGQTPPQQSSSWTGGQIALIVILLVLSCPIWIGLVIGLFGVIVGIFGALIGIIAAFGACGIASFVAGIAAFFTGSPAAGLFGLGISLFFIGLFPLALYPLCKLMVKFTVVCCKGIASLVRKLTGRKEVA